MEFNEIAQLLEQAFSYIEGMQKEFNLEDSGILADLNKMIIKIYEGA